ncbi:MAG: cytochrome c biogenesis protein CcsA [Bacteroidetes bacterium]|nr:cytochrome c biogenesis protein CcsA [Bacteroidota bacterium]HET6245043.1 cytochrome c biogenesis protein CcsA [Bacteroidia bacterium]
MEIQYIGEQLLPGQTGNFFIVLSFISALVAAISYFFAVKENPLIGSWKRFARVSFLVHSLAIFGIIATLFYLLFNHRFEYYYIWQHSSTELPMRYILSCFWEGQEGSFLLWSFWHVILGLFLLRVSKSWEAPVMSVFSMVQVFLTSMLLGIWVLGYKLGSNPFLLLRDHPDMANLPFLLNPEYLAQIDGRGLNPLLQNYWMTIHPPVLFLGFASTLVPFAYAIAGLWTQKYTEWLKPAIPWTYFGIMIFGTGILMGGAWAYEALSFGGFWAWDPVENASLVPWLTMVGAAHVMIIHKNKGTSLFTTFFLTIITFILVLYSTFLTRSGILGDSSVHAFADLGMAGQLLVYLLFFSIGAGILLAFNYKHLPKNEKEESIMSREFWMFIGSLVLLISAFQISFTTSIPVINAVFQTNLAPPLDPVAHYNSWQLPFAIIIALLIAIGQYLKYKDTSLKEFFKKISIALAAAIILSATFAWSLKMDNVFHILLLFTSMFAVIANINYYIFILKGKINFSGASIAHIGFALLLFGALLSTSKSTIISTNTSGIDIKSLGDSFSNQDNIMLVKGDTLRMGNYFVIYKGKKTEGINIHYEVEYLTKDKEDNYTSEFTLFPLIQTNPRMGNVAEPDTRHFLSFDVYTHITYAELDEPKITDSDKYKAANSFMASIGDTLFSSNSIIILEDVSRKVDKEKYQLAENDMAVKARLKITDINNTVSFVEPLFILRDDYIVPVQASSEELGLKFTFDKIDTETGKIQINIAEKHSNSREFIIMKAIIFPYINILWMGCIIMVIGTMLAIRHRLIKK